MREVDLDPCEICLDQQAETLPSGFDGIEQSCPRCGHFRLSGTAGSLLRRARDRRARATLSGWVREQFVAGSVPLITSVVLENVLRRRPSSISDRSDGLLREARRGLGPLGASFNISEPRFLAATYSASKEDVVYLARMLENRGNLKFLGTGGDCQILPDGYMRLEDVERRQPISSQGFIAMWFDPGLNKIYEDGFQKGILAAGYDPLRIDRVEHINRIDDEIIRQINASRFLVADFTGHRGGVYFEAGYALGRGLPVFWTCRKSDLCDLHFDIRQFNCIDWETPEELAIRLTSRIEAVAGPGPIKVSPTSAS
ncbi:hypothetical protein [Stagnimonas aquatica]|uniref:hypothetical protein n=1 Tax=Stagnimonas aquatica TaxID=2689987 RepID=UPI0011CDC493|nr:hypothetical protein [Stagnimonas aquatica]